MEENLSHIENNGNFISMPSVVMIFFYANSESVIPLDFFEGTLHSFGITFKSPKE
jgi:hypothetical protein